MTTPPAPSPTLTAESPVGWYECREKGRRILRRSFWWSGARLFLSPDDNLGVAMVGYTDFIGPLVPATDFAAAREEIERLTKERTLLAAGIAKLAIAAGIIQDQNLAGPQLLCLVDDLAAEIERLKAGAETAGERVGQSVCLACGSPNVYMDWSAPTPATAAVRCFTGAGYPKGVWALASDGSALYFAANGNIQSCPQPVTAEDLQKAGCKPLTFPTALALLADRPAQQARLAAMQSDPQPSGDAAKG